MTHRFLSLVTVLALVLVACGGGTDVDSAEATLAPASSADSDEPTTTQAPETKESTTSIAAATSAADLEYCEEGQESPFEPVDVFTGDLEAEVNEWISQIETIEANAPDEIAADVKVVADAARQLAALLAEFEYDLLQIPPDDERLAAFDAVELEQAVRNIGEFCGIDLDEEAGSGPGTDGGGFLTEDLPDDFIEALVPPGFQGADNNGAAGILIASDASYDDLVAFYIDVLGDPSVEGPDSATFDGTIDGQMVFVNVVRAEDGLTLVTVLSF